MVTAIAANSPALSLALAGEVGETNSRTNNLAPRMSVDSAVTANQISQFWFAHSCSRGIAIVTVTLAAESADTSTSEGEEVIQVTSGNAALPFLLSSSEG